MTNNELYLFIFEKLDNMYFSNESKYDKLGIILGQMSPDTFVDCESADPAVKEEFNNLLKKKFDGNEYSEDDGKEIAKIFLGNYLTKYGYEIDNVLKDIDMFF